MCVCVCVCVCVGCAKSVSLENILCPMAWFSQVSLGSGLPGIHSFPFLLEAASRAFQGTSPYPTGYRFGTAANHSLCLLPVNRWHQT